MTYTSYLIATCVCGETTEVTETVHPGSRYDPPEGETTPEACCCCGLEFDDSTKFEPDEPDPDRERDWADDGVRDPF